MFAQKFLAVASLASIVLPPQVDAQAAVMAKPQGQWIVDFADDHCLAGHKFVTDYGETIFQFQPDMMRTNATINIIFPTGEMTDRQWGEIKVDWAGRTDETRPTPYYQVMALTTGQRMLTLSTPISDLPATSDLDLHITFSENTGFFFRLTNWGKLQTLMKQCAADLRTSKGLPGESYDQVRSHAEGSVLKYVGPDDYPSEAMKKREQGDVWVTYWIEADGRVSDCIVDKSSGSRSLDAQTCRVVKRVRFKPAIGLDGNPVREPGSTRLRWRMPD